MKLLILILALSTATSLCKALPVPGTSDVRLHARTWDDVWDYFGIDDDEGSNDDETVKEEPSEDDASGDDNAPDVDGASDDDDASDDDESEDQDGWDYSIWRKSGPPYSTAASNTRGRKGKSLIQSSADETQERTAGPFMKNLEEWYGAATEFWEEGAAAFAGLITGEEDKNQPSKVSGGPQQTGQTGANAEPQAVPNTTCDIDDEPEGRAEKAGCTHPGNLQNYLNLNKSPLYDERPNKIEEKEDVPDYPLTNNHHQNDPPIEASPHQLENVGESEPASEASVQEEQQAGQNVSPSNGDTASDKTRLEKSSEEESPEKLKNPLEYVRTKRKGTISEESSASNKKALAAENTAIGVGSPKVDLKALTGHVLNEKESEHPQDKIVAHEKKGGQSDPLVSPSGDSLKSDTVINIQMGEGGMADCTKCEKSKQVDANHESARVILDLNIAGKSANVVSQADESRQSEGSIGESKVSGLVAVAPSGRSAIPVVADQASGSSGGAPSGENTAPVLVGQDSAFGGVAPSEGNQMSVMNEQLPLGGAPAPTAPTKPSRQHDEKSAPSGSVGDAPRNPSREQKLFDDNSGPKNRNAAPIDSAHQESKMRGGSTRLANSPIAKEDEYENSVPGRRSALSGAVGLICVLIMYV